MIATLLIHDSDSLIYVIKIRAPKKKMEARIAKEVDDMRTNMDVDAGDPCWQVLYSDADVIVTPDKKACKKRDKKSLEKLRNQSKSK